MACNRALREVRKTLRHLISQHPFYGALALRLQIEPDQDIPDIATDGVSLFINPEWVSRVTREELMIPLAKVVMACTLKHHLRRKHRDYMRWQIASHLVTLPFMQDAGLSNETLPGWDTSAEKAYDKLPPGDGDGQGRGSGDGQGNPYPEAPPPGQILDAPRDSKHTEAEHESAMRQADQDWDHATQRALQSAKRAGKVPGMFQEKIQAELYASAPWEDIMSRFLTANTLDELTWRRPNRRFIAERLYLPSRDGLGMPPVVFAVDTSGSMDEKALTECWGNIRATCAMLRPEKIMVIQADVAVHQIDTYDSDDLPEEITVHGRGGTSYKETMTAYADLPPAACLIYFTDLFCNDFGQEPDCPVLWAVEPKGDREAAPPFGEIIYLGDDDS